MHLIETYALNSASKIGKPFILPKFFPLSLDQYISFHPFSKYDSKNYSYWADVLEIIYPELSKRDIKIVQIGAQGEKPLRQTYNTVGQTTINQSAYIISNAILHLGADSFATHIASWYNKPIVAIYSNNYINVVRPYWTEDKDCVLIEPKRGDTKPSFSAEEFPKTINLIKPEEIALAVLKLLGIEHDYRFETFYLGQIYSNRFVETVPNQIVNAQNFGVDAMVVRMDYLFDENCLVEQLKVCKCSIVTNKPISDDILKAFKPNIKELVYTIDENHKPDFVKRVIKHGFPVRLISALEPEMFRAIKLDYLDAPIVMHSEPLKNPIIRTIKEKGRKFLYSSAKRVLSQGKFYPSKAAWLQNISISENENIHDGLDGEDFWKEIDFFKILLTRD